MNICDTPLQGLKIVDTKRNIDSRGSFSRWFCGDALSAILEGKNIAQINSSKNTHSGTIRGLHFQHPPAMETKLVRCIQGKVFDVAVDIRKESSTFLQWFGIELSAENSRMMFIPQGFAHGFQVLAEHSELLYLHSEFYSPECEDGIKFDDPKLNINWPLSCTDISPRDKAHSFITNDFEGLIL